MSASGYTPIQLYRSSTSGTAPTSGNLSDGELAINIANTDMALYAKNASGTVKRLINNPAGLKYPTADGTNGQAVTTDGAGNLTFSTVGGASLTGTTDSSSPFLTALGVGAGTNITTGYSCTTVGYQAGNSNSTAPYLTAFGFQAAKVSTIGYSTAFGANAALSETNGYNTSIGYSANTSVTTGVYNTSLGHRANGNVTGQNNVAVGAFSLGAAISTSSSYNVAIGDYTLTNVTGNQNVTIGYQAGRAVTTGASNTLIGYNAGYSGTNNITTGSNNIIIGNAAAASSATISNEITLGNSSIATLRCQVTSITSLSDARDKKNVTKLKAGLDFVNSLLPVDFVWNTRDGGKVDIKDSGFLAQDLKKAQIDNNLTIPGLVYDMNPDRLEASYGKLIPVLVNAIQELSIELEKLKTKVQ